MGVPHVAVSVVEIVQWSNIAEAMEFRFVGAVPRSDLVIVDGF